MGRKKLLGRLYVELNNGREVFGTAPGWLLVGQEFDDEWVGFLGWEG
jgi:hypothetical protein